jgi:hypothetical protein
MRGFYIRFSNIEEGESMGKRVAAVAAIAAMAAAAWAVAPGGAASSKYANASWYQKYLVVSAPGFSGAKGSASSSVTVGPNVDASNEVGPQSETSIAINPANRSAVVGGANEIFRLPMRAYYSSDAGASYGGVDLPLPPPVAKNGFDFGSDPGVAWDTFGRVYYSYIVVFFGAGGGINGTEMAVARSSDGGRTWVSTYFNQNGGEGAFNDKPMITVDNSASSPNFGTVYVAWDNNNGNSNAHNNVLVSRSTDGGATFSAPVVASGNPSGGQGVIGADPYVTPNGTLHVAWKDADNNRIAESSSTDGGLTFGAVHTVAPTQIPFDIAIPAEQSRGALMYPACGAVSNTVLACSFTDGSLAAGTDVFLSRSTDGGSTWSDPLRVNDDAAGAVNDQFNQWLAVDPADGSVNVSWSDTRNDPTRAATDEYYARSTNGGRSFSSNVKISTASTNDTCCGANLGDQYGDYEGIAASNHEVIPIWTDRRDSVAAAGLMEESFTATILTK